MLMSDLASDCISANVTFTALQDACGEIRRSATAQNPFMPPSGEILQLAKRYTEQERTINAPGKRQDAGSQIAKEPIQRDVKPWYGKMWNQFTASDKEALSDHLSSMTESEAENYRKYMRSFCGGCV